MSLRKKVIRTVLMHRSQYIGAMILVLLSCALFVTFNTMGANVQKSLDTFKSRNVQEDAYFVAAEPLKNTNALQSEYDVRIEERRAYDLAYGDTATLRVLSATDTIDRYEVTKGADLNHPNDILLDSAFAAAHDIRIGDTLRVFGEDFTVAGFACTPDYIYP